MCVCVCVCVCVCCPSHTPGVKRVRPWVSLGRFLSVLIQVGPDVERVAHWLTLWHDKQHSLKSPPIVDLPPLGMSCSETACTSDDGGQSVGVDPDPFKSRTLPCDALMPAGSHVKTGPVDCA